MFPVSVKVSVLYYLYVFVLLCACCILLLYMCVRVSSVYCLVVSYIIFDKIIVCL